MISSSLGDDSQCQNEQNNEKTSEDDQIPEQRVNDHNSDVVAGIDYGCDRKKDGTRRQFQSCFFFLVGAFGLKNNTKIGADKVPLTCLPC